jgi:hypothetical protein
MKELRNNEEIEANKAAIRGKLLSRIRGPNRRPRSMKEGRIWQCHLCDKAYFRSNSLKIHFS